jgi:hypothetical protein
MEYLYPMWKEYMLLQVQKGRFDEEYVLYMFNQNRKVFKMKEMI